MRRPRTIGRFMAAWFLLWVCAMTVAPPPAAHNGGQAAAHADAATHDHAQHQPPDCDHADVEPHADHQEHAPGSASHCPVCMHAAAPAPQHPAPDLTGRRPADVPVVGPSAPLSMRAALPPPARGPPALS